MLRSAKDKCQCSVMKAQPLKEEYKSKCILKLCDPVILGPDRDKIELVGVNKGLKPKVWCDWTVRG